MKSALQHTLEEGPPIWRSWYFMLLILAGRGFKNKHVFARFLYGLGTVLPIWGEQNVLFLLAGTQC